MSARRAISLLIAASMATSAFAQTPDNITFEQQLRQHSAAWLGRDYAFSPLGEEQAPDHDPRLRLDAFDCTTYVETVLAFSLREDPRGRAEMLDALRYRGQHPHFEQRRHFPAAQWLPGLQQLGVLRDVTADVAGPAMGTATGRLSPQRWAQREWRILRDLPASAVPTTEVRIHYLPLHLGKRLHKLQETAVLSVVHAEHSEVPLLVSHQALLIPGADGARVRHARDGLGVVEESLARFLHRLTLSRRWPVLGVNIADLQVPPSTD